MFDATYVYFKSVEGCGAPLYPPERQAEIDACESAKARAEKYSVWALLGEALGSCGADIRDFNFKKNSHGKWEAEGFYFSLSHSFGAACVALSDCPVGVDCEQEEAFFLRLGDDKFLTRFADCILTDKERGGGINAMRLLRLWTAKESIYKAVGGEVFRPSLIDGSGVYTDEVELFGKTYCYALSGGTGPVKVRIL